MPSTSNNDQLFGGVGNGTKEKLNNLLDSFMNFVSSSFDFAPQSLSNEIKSLWKKNIIESRWELFMKSKFAKHWLPELSYLDGWTLSELILLLLILLMSCSWFTIRNDRKNTELIHQHQHQHQHQHHDDNVKQKQKQKKQKKKQRGDNDRTATTATSMTATKKYNANDPKNDDKEESSKIWPSSLPSFDSTTIILNQLITSSYYLNNGISTITPNIRSLGFSTGTSWERRLQTISMFSCSLAFVMPGSLFCWITVLHFGLLLPYHVFFVLNDNANDNANDNENENYHSNNTDYDYDILPSWYKLKTATICVSLWIYMIHAFLFDTSPTTGSRIAWLRFGKWNWWWNYACDYLPVVLVKTADLPPTQTIRIGNNVYTTPMKYVMAYHPHGIIAVGAFCSFATDSVRTLDLSISKEETDATTSTATTAKKQQQQRRTLRPSALSLLELEEKENKQQNQNQNQNKSSSNQNQYQRGFSSLYPNLDRRLVTLPVNFTIPFIRDYFLGLGAIDSKKETFRNYLNLDLSIGSTTTKSTYNGSNKKSTKAVKTTNPNEGRAMIVVVGGAAESMIAHSNRIELILQKRRGFVREAIMANANLVPVLGFGETNLYTLYDNDHDDDDDDDNDDDDSSSTALTTSTTISTLQKFVKNTFGVAVPLFTGRSILFKSLGIMPRRSPVVVVVGKPIPPPTSKQLDNISNKEFHPLIDKITDEPINNHGRILKEWHTRYVHELEELYNKYKDAKWNQPGKNRQQSMRIVR
jgi:lipopolysaccharide export LptBFGC system permease protein LptF